MRGLNETKRGVSSLMKGLTGLQSAFVEIILSDYQMIEERLYTAELCENILVYA